MSIRSECNLLSVGGGGEDKITEDKDEEIDQNWPAMWTMKSPRTTAELEQGERL